MTTARPHKNTSRLSSELSIFGARNPNIKLFRTTVNTYYNLLLNMTNSSNITATQQQKSIEQAAKSKNPIGEAFPEYSQYERDGFKVSLICKQKSDLDPKIVKWAFKLAEANVGPFYKICKLGWQPNVKKKDLNKDWARYLVAMDEKKNNLGYAMFRFDMDYGSSVLYCYELQVDKSVQRKGLGKFMMTALEKCAQHFGLERTVLTVLKNNPDGMAFFKSLGYSVDDTSPEKSEEADYEILSKTFT